MMRQLRAWWVLGWALLAKVLLFPFMRNKGARPWLEQLHKEAIVPIAPATWQLATTASRCIGCGLCDVVTLGAASPSRISFGVGRRAADALLDLDAATRLRARARDVSRVCPAGVSVEAAATLVTDNARMLGALD